MDLETLRGFADLMEERGLTRIKLEEPDLTLELEREGAGATQPPAWPAFPPAMPAAWPAAPAAAVAAPAAPATAEPAAPTEPAPVASGATEVCAPMVGVFYAAPTPESDPFVRVGQRVKRGDVLCIVEAMKLMNEIVAEKDGEIFDICVSNGDVVEFGQCLFRLN